MHLALSHLDWPLSNLHTNMKLYQSRYTDRAELRARLKALPDMIESTRQLVEIAARRREKTATKAKPATDWKAKWQEVAPGLVVPLRILKAYLKTFSEPIPLDETTVKVTPDHVFHFTPTPTTRLRIPCIPWDMAERITA
jgi:hypothetical protein